jgi:hypothetical protein
MPKDALSQPGVFAKMIRVRIQGNVACVHCHRSALGALVCPWAARGADAPSTDTASTRRRSKLRRALQLYGNVAVGMRRRHAPSA